MTVHSYYFIFKSPFILADPNRSNFSSQELSGTFCLLDLLCDLQKAFNVRVGLFCY